jgi:hypothetical protein
MEYDGRFLEETLLRDLRTEPEEDAINPAHLQIVCHHLYRAARRRHRNKIEIDLYPEGGIGQILTGLLLQSMGRLGPDRQELASALLKRMVSVTGERLFLTPGELAKEAGEGPSEEADARLANAQVVLDALLRDGLLETLVREDGELTYSLSHHLLAEEVHGWFDREEALNGIAQEALDRAWQIWYGQVHAPAAEEGAREPDVQPLLVAEDRLREIRARRDNVTIDGPQICLLLHSAVHHRCDMAYWASEVRKHEEAAILLEKVQLGQVDRLDKLERRKAILCAEALGLSPDDLVEGALARAAVGDGDGNVRHTAALALGALGMEAVHSARAKQAGHRWRQVQVLAQIKAAGLPLPQLPGSLLIWVNAWLAGIRLYEARWRLASQAMGAGIGGGGLLVLLMLAVTVVRLIAIRSELEPEMWKDLSRLWVGDAALRLLVIGLVGAVFAATRWLLGRTRLGWAGRVLGGGLGFCLGMLTWILYMPDVGPWQVLAWITTGVAIALGWELGATRGRASVPWRAGLGGGIGGAIAFGAFAAVAALAMVETNYGLTRFLDQETSYRLAPLLDQKDPIFKGLAEARWLPGLVVAIGALTGAAIGGGMAAGAIGGELLWRRLSPEPGNRSFNSEADGG